MPGRSREASALARPDQPASPVEQQSSARSRGHGADPRHGTAVRISGRSDADPACRSLIECADEILLIPAPVLVEVDYWIHRRLYSGALVALLADIEQGAYAIEDLVPADYVRVRQICDRYADADTGFVDAAVPVGSIDVKALPFLSIATHSLVVGHESATRAVSEAISPGKFASLQVSGLPAGSVELKNSAVLAATHSLVDGHETATRASPAW